MGRRNLGKSLLYSHDQLKLRDTVV